MPINGKAFRSATVVTLHDLYPYDIPGNFGFPQVLFNRAVLRQCLRSVDAIACVSHGTRSRLQRIAPVLAGKKAEVIYNSVANSLERAPECLTYRPWWCGSPFLLCVAQHRRNKNIVLALNVFKQLLVRKIIAANTRFLLVGIRGPETSSIQRGLMQAGLTENVLLVEGISEAHLQWSYRNCELLLAPSTHEGFGLPVAEALLAGCRVVCSDIPAFRELGAGHCRFVPLGGDEVEAFVAAAAAAMREPSSPPISMPHLSAPVIGEAYMRLYRSLIEQPGRRTSVALEPLEPAAERQRAS